MTHVQAVAVCPNGRMPEGALAKMKVHLAGRDNDVELGSAYCPSCGGRMVFKLEFDDRD